jgi:hypothetical protein
MDVTGVVVETGAVIAVGRLARPARALWLRAPRFVCLGLDGTKLLN